MFSKISGDGRQLVYYDCDINDGDPVFLDIGDEEPVSLLGGCDHAAAISDKCEVIFINRDAVTNLPNSRIAAVSLPDGEKASSAACLEDSAFVLSSNSRVFRSKIESESSIVRFSGVSELGRYEIVWVSGTDEHCFAVNKEGRFFGLGSNSCGQLGLGKETKSVSSFTEISSLLKYTKSEQPTMEVLIHFLRHEKEKSSHAVLTDMASSSSAAVQAKNVFIHQER